MPERRSICTFIKITPGHHSIITLKSEYRCRDVKAQIPLCAVVPEPERSGWKTALPSYSGQCRFRYGHPFTPSRAAAQINISYAIAFNVEIHAVMDRLKEKLKKFFE